ncbi:MerC domain-containing protein [Phenylobacterium sp.]|uniref:MerC domain-containing protein n=1 Tax=Phenylobacterium sp. TaxID=1871053 RepID=UPI0027306E12|nr:MerC domain-containing protein [Phenylobacterium sp.]MDP1617706.1 MerC domain-containing protein [Phenylobacterium sp.]MDP1986728.1 MerC domain-containing protein [Phenylobacterium sp.]
MKLSTAGLLDGSAIGLSGLCLIHCLALPVAAAFAPLVGLWGEAEWVHLAFVILAAPLSVGALLLAQPRRLRPISLAASGLALLVSGLVFHDAETLLTVAGGLTLASAHLMNWKSRAARHSHAHST